MKVLPLQARVGVRTSNMKFSRRRLVYKSKKMHQKACRTCSTIIFLHSTNQIIDLWRCRRQILNSLGASSMPKIPEISVGIQLERSVSVSSDWNIRDHLWRWSTYFGWKIPIEIRRSIFDIHCT